MTTALEGGEGSASCPGRYLPPGKTRYLLYRRLGGPQGRSGQVRKISPPSGFDPRTVQLVASCYTDYATRPTPLLYGCEFWAVRQQDKYSIRSGEMKFMSGTAKYKIQNTRSKITEPVKLFCQNSKLAQLWRKFKITEMDTTCSANGQSQTDCHT